jgi:hypothetical protein
MTALREQEKALIANLAAVVRVQNGNRHDDINKLLAHADALLLILDAEGDGGAAAEIVVDRDSGGREWFDIKVFDRTIPHGTKLYTRPQPARSGGVSDEDVRGAAVAYSRRATDGSQDVNFHDCIRAALENFVKSQGESNV